MSAASSPLSSPPRSPVIYKLQKSIWDVNDIEELHKDLLTYVHFLHKDRSVKYQKTEWVRDTSEPSEGGDLPAPDRHLDPDVPDAVNSMIEESRYIFPVHPENSLPGIVFNTIEPIKAPIDPQNPSNTPKPGVAGDYPAPRWMRRSRDATNVTLIKRWGNGFGKTGSNYWWHKWGQETWERCLPDLYNLSGFFQRRDPLKAEHIESACELAIRDINEEGRAKIYVVPTPWTGDGMIRACGKEQDYLEERDFIVFIRTHEAGGQSSIMIVNQRSGLCLYSDPAWDLRSTSDIPSHSQAIFRDTVKLVRNWYRIHKAPAETQDLIDHATFVIPNFQLESSNDLWKCGLYNADFARCVLREGNYSLETTWSQYAAEKQIAGDNYHELLLDYWVWLIVDEFGPRGGNNIKGLRPKPNQSFDEWANAADAMARNGRSRRSANANQAEERVEGLRPARPDRSLVAQDSIQIAEEDPIAPSNTHNPDDLIRNGDPDPSTYQDDVRRRDCPIEGTRKEQNQRVEMENLRRGMCRAKAERRELRLNLPKNATRPSDYTLDDFLLAQDDPIEDVAWKTKPWDPYLPLTMPEGYLPPSMRRAKELWEEDKDAARVERETAENLAQSEANGSRALRARRNFTYTK
ncbi:hypothetical protein GQ607_001994 [Colletotrichum asianum]|uniref:Uncharacterized protein n=1 Tax=Colletotrichum asianum TaxID=702518 RepID=A0A8H3ZG40_9PEZI|nr:hypothetical protein GQ607_017913 [Colletotrichum asianum]KAF0330590.1 hypothetical protein GQ607_001994 [Colletotrichum asianum]